MTRHSQAGETYSGAEHAAREPGKIPWQVMILGGEISQGTMLKVCRGWCTRGTAAKCVLIW